MLLNRLRRITRDGRWIPEVDGLRFVAIASVFLFHLSGELKIRSGRIIPVESQYWILDRLVAHGDRGVRLFFVISGMILAMPFARHHLLKSKPVSLRKYYMRRLTRLEPPYIASVILAAILEIAYAHGIPSGYISHALASLIYQHSLIFGQMSLINSVTWSLEVEIQFYVVAPLVMMLFAVQNEYVRRGLMVLAIVLISFAQLPFMDVTRFGLSICGSLQYFLMGLLVADVYVINLDRMKSSWVWDLAGLLALAAIFWPNYDKHRPQLVLPLAIGILCVGAMRSHILRRVLANPTIAVIGGMCYSIYLLHFLLIAVVFKVSKHFIIPTATFLPNYLIQLATMAIPLTIAFVGFFVLIERPCMDPDWPTKLWVKLTGSREHEPYLLDSADISE